MQRKLLLKGDKLSLKEALKLALSMEVAYKDSQDLTQPAALPQVSTPDQVKKVSQKDQRSFSQKGASTSACRLAMRVNDPCYSCTGGDCPDICRYKNEEMFLLP